MIGAETLKMKLGLTNNIQIVAGAVVPTDERQVDSVRRLLQQFGDAPIRRKSFNPLMMPPAALPQTCLLDVERGDRPLTFRYRVWGTGMRDVVGADLTGKTVMDFPRRSCRVYLSELFNKCVETRQIVFSSAAIEYPNGFHLHTQKLFVPMVDDQGLPEKILTVFTFDFDPRSDSEANMANEPNGVREQYSVFESIGALEQAISEQEEAAGSVTQQPPVFGYS